MKKRVVLRERFYGQESFEELESLLKEVGFLGGGSHVEARWGARMVYFFSRTPSIPCSDCSGCDIKEIDLIDGITNHVFFDVSDREIKFGVVLYGTDTRGRKKWIGSFCPKDYFLYGTDWTHDEECVKFAKQAIKRMIDLGILRRGWSEDSEPAIKFPGARVVIGSDPEFELSEKWDIYSPISQNIFSEEGINYGPYGNIGADGAEDQLEFRPAPSEKIRKHLANLKYLIGVLGKPLSIIGNRFPLGCHIHFGIPREGKVFIKSMVEVLDDFLGKYLLNLSGSARGSYKKLGQWEEKPWGFEYRSLPSAILLNPEVARIIFKIAKNVVQSLLRKGKIEYNLFPRFEDYRRIAKLSKREYDYFMEFKERYHDIVWNTPVITGLWVKKKNEVMKLFNVIFRDDWNSETREIVQSFFKKKANLLKKDIRIVIYGLREDRGIVVAGYESKFAERQDLGQESWTTERIVIGWPWVWRVGKVSREELMDRLNEVWKVIYKFLNQKGLLKERKKRKRRNSVSEVVEQFIMTRNNEDNERLNRVLDEIFTEEV